MFTFLNDFIITIVMVESVIVVHRRVVYYVVVCVVVCVVVYVVVYVVRLSHQIVDLLIFVLCCDI